MKKILTLFFTLILVSKGFSQTYDNWDFTTSTVTTFPAGFVTWNEDGQTLNSQLTGALPGMSATAPWSIDITDFQESVALTGSYFTSTVASSRWLVTPNFAVPAGVPGVSVTWYATSLGPIVGQSYYDNYRVLVSTTDSLPSSFTPLVTITGETGNQHALSLAAYQGQNIRIAFQDTTTNAIGLLMTGIQVVNLPSLTATLNDLEIYEHNWINNPIQISGTLTNPGVDTITSYTLNYSVNGAAPVTAPITGVSYPSQQSFYYYHPTVFNPTVAGTYKISVWFSNINNTSATSDTVSTTIFYYHKVPGLVKNVLVEEFTGAWCGYCPGGALAIHDLISSEPYAVAVAIHDQAGGTTADDAMQIPAGDAINTAFNTTGYPSAMIDRLFFFDNQGIALGFDLYSGPTTTVQDTATTFRYHQATPVNVSLTNQVYDTVAGTLTVSVNANFLDSLSQGDYRLNLIVVEDSIITTGAGYNQHNYYASGGDNVDPGSPLASLPAVITNDGQTGDWAQNHVLRAMTGGAWGTTGIIPSNPAAGNTYSTTYTTPIKPTWRPQFVSVIGVVQEYNTNINLRTVLNVVSAPILAQPSGIAPTASFNSLSVYPNPASTMAVVQVDMKQDAMINITVLNTLGQVAVASTDVLLNTGTHTVNVPVSNLTAGLYFVKITVNGEVSTVPLSVSGK